MATTTHIVFERSLVAKLRERMVEPRQFIQVLIGPRQTGKTTALKQALQKIEQPYHYVSAESVSAQGRDWLRGQWQVARGLITSSQPSALLVVDEIQAITQWSELVKALWDEDSWADIDLRVVLSGSSSLLLQKGLSESLVGRFELLRSTHWSYTECTQAFGYSVDDFLLYGGYPGGAKLRENEDRWFEYLQNSIIEATISRDIIELESVRKPAVMRALFNLGSFYSGQEISYRKLLGQLDDAGNATTIAHYLDLLTNAGLLTGLQKYTGKILSTRNSTPRLAVFDTALIHAAHRNESDTILKDPAQRGHLIESAVGAYLLARAALEHFDVYWWREGTNEVDFVLKRGEELTALEVKAGSIKGQQGLGAFVHKFPNTRALIVGTPQTSLEDFLSGKIELF